MLREQVGDDAFKVAVKNYLLKYQFKNVETKNFIDEVELASGKDLSLFVENYLINTEFFKDELIKQSETILNNLRNKNDIFSCKSASINQISFAKWDLLYGSMSDFVRIDYFKRLMKDSLIDKTNLFRGILNSKDFKIRQLVAQTLTKIPITLQAEYEALLADDSYSTIETALFNLWVNFPRKRNFYLNKTKDVQGFNDKNIRQLWLTLALLTEDYETENKSKYFDELTSYTGSNYGFETRQNAFQYLRQMQACNALCHKNLEQATKHHNWRFSKFAKTLLKAE